MGNNNTTVLHEEESWKLENKGESQDQVLLADEKEKGFVAAGDPDSLANGKTENGVHPLNTSDETKPQTKGSEEQRDGKHATAELGLSEIRGEIHSDGSDVASVAVDHHFLQTETSVTEGEPMDQSRVVDKGEIPEPETEKVGNESVGTESGGDKNPDEKSVQEETEPDKENSLERVKIEAKDSDRDREVDETSKETQKSSSDGDLSENNAEQEILNLENDVDDDDDVPPVEPILQEIDPFEKSGIEVQMIERCMEGRETDLRRMSRSRSLPVRRNTARVLTDPLVQPIERFLSEVSCHSSNKNKCLKEEVAEDVENIPVSCVARNDEQEVAETETDNIGESEPEMRSPSFGSDLKIEARAEDSSDRTPLLYEDKAEMYETTVMVEEKTITMKRSESERSRKEVFAALLKKEDEKNEADDHYEEPGGSGDNLRDKKPSSDSPKGGERRRSKASLFGTCLCCATVMK
ncbi:PREDICTED: uncharacterized protein LOC104809081 [Tarenaya hassleriana]|uniref:uncharacterized protein LOC104809081 n=1 Tax=Tarenaya hassleriana TaxID=28532 RepID=UPI00053C17A7|nr:PREDICTED: uncharacterized protein LOC104809081 [Tarenaya hassleriana]